MNMLTDVTGTIFDEDECNEWGERYAGGAAARESEDPLSDAARELFGAPYLFPYQRLVISNIIEAAGAAGIAVRRPMTGPAQAEGAPRRSDSGGLPARDANPDDDRGCLGRQIVILPTGAGKSLCFQLPAALLDGPTLVIYPLLSLMADQERRLSERMLVSVTLRGGQSREERQVIFQAVKSGKSRFIIANPEVLLTQSVLGTLPELGIVHVVIDEAHCVSEWGESFRPSYLEIGRIVAACLAPVVTAFTATASAPVLEKIDRYIFGGTGAHRIIGNPDRSNICYHAAGTLLRDRMVCGLLARHKRPAIVFCSSRQGTESLARYLRVELQEQEIRFYHAGLTKEEKTAVEKWFFYSAAGVLVATCAYGMGVDKSDIRTVIHRGCPPSVEAYLQESGRAGRDGRAAKAFLLWGPEDERALSRAKTESAKSRLSGILAYGRNVGDSQENPRCRRDALLDLLDYAGERVKPETGCCDVCEGTARQGLIEEQPLIHFFRRNPRSFTENEAAALLGEDGRTGWTEEEARTAIREMIRARKLRISKNPFWKKTIDLSTNPAR